MNSRVLKVEAGLITVADPEGKQTGLPFGTCVWATGIAKTPLVKQLQELFPQQQTHSRWVHSLPQILRSPP